MTGGPRLGAGRRSATPASTSATWRSPYSAGRFVSPGSPLTGAVAERDWLERRYEAATGEPVDRAVVDLYAAMGALMLFSIMGTGLALYAAGESTDIRAAWSRFVFPGLRADLAALMGW